MAIGNGGNAPEFVIPSRDDPGDPGGDDARPPATGGGTTTVGNDPALLGQGGGTAPTGGGGDDGGNDEDDDRDDSPNDASDDDLIDFSNVDTQPNPGNEAASLPGNEEWQVAAAALSLGSESILGAELVLAGSPNPAPLGTDSHYHWRKNGLFGTDEDDHYGDWFEWNLI